MVCWDMGAGCGGFTHMKKLISMCIEKTNAIIWMVDSSDRLRLQESVEILQQILDLTNFANGRVPILILANKQDMAGSISLDEIRKAFAPPLTGYTFNVFRSSCLEEMPKSGIPEAFYWLRLVLQLLPMSSSATNEPLVPILERADLRNGGLAEKLDSWVTRASNDVPTDEYLSLFEALSLPSWDHYAHVRIAYIILTKFGRQKGKDLIFNGIERYIKESGRAGGRTFHLTMTYLWIQLVHFGIQNVTASLPASAPSDKSSNPLPSSTDDFARFLLLNSYVVDGNIWANYYSKDVIMTPAAKASLVLPDKKPLPSVLSRDAV
ncbi:ADP-ribosylation factor [Pleurotus pulmonarius]